MWWDDQLLEEKPARTSPAQSNLLASADFNCPGGSKMFLDGKATDRSTERPRGDVALEKTDDRIFEDDWDFVIDNYTAGANDPYIIDSISNLTGTPPISPVVVSHPVLYLYNLLPSFHYPARSRLPLSFPTNNPLSKKNSAAAAKNW
ncbi:MAG: hypothetical protein QM781_10270 [Chitinophagaceae bacterium]